MEELKYEEFMEAQQEEHAKVSFNTYSQLANGNIGEYDNNMLCVNKFNGKW